MQMEMDMEMRMRSRRSAAVWWRFVNSVRVSNVEYDRSGTD